MTNELNCEQLLNVLNSAKNFGIKLKDVRVVYERIEDSYFRVGGWETVPLQGLTLADSLEEADSDFIEAHSCSFNPTEKMLKITAHF